MDGLVVGVVTTAGCHDEEGDRAIGEAAAKGGGAIGEAAERGEVGECSEASENAEDVEEEDEVARSSDAGEV
jgi:hypothetical protein